MEEGWEDVYAVYPLSKFGVDDKGFFYQTYSGGPEGGFFIQENGLVIPVERTWGTTFQSVGSLTQFKLIFKKPCKETYLWQCKVVNKEEPDLDEPPTEV